MKHSLRKSARGQQCHLRLPGICNGDPETTVLAHIRRGGVAGMGQKPPDVCAVFACNNCHDYMDHRSRDPKLIIPDLSAYILDGQQRTLKYWWDNGYLNA